MKNNELNMSDTGLNHEQLSNLRNASVHPPADALRKVQHSIRKKARLIFLYRAAAVLALVGMVIFFMQLPFSTSDQAEQQAVTRSMENPVVPEKSATDVIQAEPKPAASDELLKVASPTTKSFRRKVSEQPSVVAHQNDQPSVPNELSVEVSPEQVITQASDAPAELSQDDAGEFDTNTPITIVYQLPAIEQEMPRRQANVARFAGFVSDLKSGQTDLGLFRTIRHVLIEPTRRQLQHNTNLQ